MNLCTCPDRPRCQMYNGKCGNYADWIEMKPASWFDRPIRLMSVFTCKPCWGFFCEYWRKPIPGLTRPEWADDLWQPSIMSCIDLARREMNERDRKEFERKRRDDTLDLEPDEVPVILQKGAKYLPEQMKQLKILSRAIRQTRRASAA